MCGIAGFLQTSTEPLGDQPVRLAAANAMAHALKHRGPDDHGVWDEGAGVTLAFRRLVIVDISAEGHQPMLSSSGRYVIVFNGEVYNFAELRRGLEALGFSFRGHSDTEVILAAFEAWGIEQSVKRFVGMFAIALWDHQERKLGLIRDRLGIKPLYYGWVNGTFLFGSELKALKAYPGFSADIDRDALCLYMRHNYIPAPYSIYQGIHKLLPGTILTVPAGARGIEDIAAVGYWSVRDAVTAGQRDRFGYSDAKACFIPNGFDLEKFPPCAEARTSTRVALAIGADDVVVGNVGRFHPLKDHATLLCAISIVYGEAPNVRVVLAGRDVNRENSMLMETIRELKLERCVVPLGEREDVATSVDGFNIFVSSSASEAFPNAVGEAMSSGVPCVVTDAGDSAELVGNTGVVVPAKSPERLAAGILELIRIGAEKRRALGESARERIQLNYSMALITRQYADLYRSVCGREKSGRSL